MSLLRHGYTCLGADSPKSTPMTANLFFLTKPNASIRPNLSKSQDHHYRSSFDDRIYSLHCYRYIKGNCSSCFGSRLSYISLGNYTSKKKKQASVRGQIPVFCLPFVISITLQKYTFFFCKQNIFKNLLFLLCRYFNSSVMSRQVSGLMLAF